MNTTTKQILTSEIADMADRAERIEGLCLRQAVRDQAARARLAVARGWMADARDHLRQGWDMTR